MNHRLLPLVRGARVAALLGSFCVVPLLPAADAPAVNVAMPSEGQALAEGFEKAFRAFSGGPLFLTYEKEGSALRTLSGIRSIEAKGAVLVIVTDKSITLAIPARRVLSLTDERPQ